MTEKTVAEVEAEVERAMAEHWLRCADGFVNRGYQGWADCFTPDIRSIQPGMDLSGSDLHGFMEKVFANGAQIFSLDVESFEIFDHGDFAYQIGQLDEEYQLPGGEPMWARQFFFARWEKQPDGGWKISRLVRSPRDAPEKG